MNKLAWAFAPPNASLAELKRIEAEVAPRVKQSIAIATTLSYSVVGSAVIEKIFDPAKKMTGGDYQAAWFAIVVLLLTIWAAPYGGSADE